MQRIRKPEVCQVKTNGRKLPEMARLVSLAIDQSRGRPPLSTLISDGSAFHRHGASTVRNADWSPDAVLRYTHTHSHTRTVTHRQGRGLSDKPQDRPNGTRLYSIRRHLELTTMEVRERERLGGCRGDAATRFVPFSLIATRPSS